MKQLKQYKGQLLFTLILVITILIMPFQDYTDRTFLPSEIQVPDACLGYVRVENDSLIIPEMKEPFLVHTDKLYFKKGTYEVTFHILAYEEGSFVEVCDPLVVNPDNTAGKLLTTAEIPAGSQQVQLSFTVDDYVECLQFRISCRSPLILYNIDLLSERGLYCDPYIYIGFLLLGSLLLLWYRTRKKVRMEVLILLAFAAIWSSMPLSYTWLYDGHDLYFHYGRLFTLSDSMLSGQFPVRIHTKLFQEMTYLCPLFYSEFFLYPFAALHILGMSPIGCYKLLVTCINFATAGIAYYSFSRLCGSRKIGSIGAFLYTLSMFRLINLYTRAAIGELLATVFLPLLLLGMYYLFIGDSRKWFYATLAFTAIFQSHIVSTAIAIGFGVLFAICFLPNLKNGKRLLHLVKAAVSTVLLNLWFIVPLLDHMQYSVYTRNDSRKLEGYSLFPIQVFDVGVTCPAAAAEGPNTYTPEMPYSLGLVLLIGILLFLFASCRRKNRPFKLGNYCLALGALAVYASTSLFPWGKIQSFDLLNKIAGSIQFASRFLPFATVFLCITSAIGIYYFFRSRELKRLLFLICAILTVYSAGNYFSNYTAQSEPYVTKETQMDRTHDTDFLYLIDNQGEYFSVRQVTAQTVTFEASDGIVLSNCYREGTNASFTYTKTKKGTESYVDVSFNNYPYFHAYDSNGTPLETSLNELLRLRILLPEAETDTITVSFAFPSFYRISDCISLATAILLAVGYGISKCRARRKITS